MLTVGPLFICAAMAVGVLGLVKRGYELLIGMAMLVLLASGFAMIAYGLMGP